MWDSFHQIYCDTYLFTNNWGDSRGVPKCLWWPHEDNGGWKFHVLSDDAKPFCVKTPWSIHLRIERNWNDLLAPNPRHHRPCHCNQGVVWSVSHLRRMPDMCSPIMTKQVCEMWEILIRHTHTTSCWYYSTQSNRLDAMKGYHQCSLDEESQLLTTFITPFCHFKYLRAHMESHPSLNITIVGCTYEAFTGLSRYRCIVDDIVIYHSDITKHASPIKASARSSTLQSGSVHN